MRWGLWLRWIIVFLVAGCNLRATQTDVILPSAEEDIRQSVVDRRQNAQRYLLASQYDPALSMLDDAIHLVEANRLNPGSDNTSTGIFSDRDLAELYVLRGQVWLGLYEWDRALADYNTAINLDSTYADAYFYRGVLFYSVLQAGLTRREDALADFEHYRELAPTGDLAAAAQNYAATIRAELATLNP